MANCSPLHHKNLSPEQLIEEVIKNQEGILSRNGALSVATGKRTGRSPRDRFIVRDEVTETQVEWGKINQPIQADIFNRLWKNAIDYIDQRKCYISDLCVGSKEEHALPVTVITEYAWHNLFACNLFIRPKHNFLSRKSAWTILSVPGIKTEGKKDGVNSDGVVILNFSEEKILLMGMEYAGEIKKAMFSVLNFLLPVENILPMHCAANMGKSGDSALFFGLSGTGKTTLSADPARLLIGDDEHGWSDKKIFNFEGGCYAKCIDLSKEREPVIWNAIKRGAIMENVVLKQNGEPNYDDTSLTENTRVAYPRDHIQSSVPENHGPHPRAVIFLTCDLYGVLPPVALLSREQAAYYFLSGYTALVGSTEVGGAKEIASTFSTCFGAPFFPRRPMEYAKLLLKRLDETSAQVYLINTGWTGGAYGAGGARFSIPTTRCIVSAVVGDELREVETVEMPVFGLRIPKKLQGIDDQLLNPRQTWENVKEYDAALITLANKFKQNFLRFDAPDFIKSAGPK